MKRLIFSSLSILQITSLEPTVRAMPRQLLAYLPIMTIKC